MRSIWLFFLGLTLLQPASGQEITLEMPNHLIARANYQPGKDNQPAVLLLHGFLQTQEFHTVYSMLEGLHEQGYTVLAPTLTLGVPYRNQSLACEAIHTNTIEDDSAEIGTWLSWLETRQHGPIILVGHSTGSTELLAYLSRHKDPRIKKLIGASIIEGSLEGGEQTRIKLIASLKQRIKAKDHSLVTHQLSFCSHYTATPESLLSYLRWSPRRILDAARASDIPITFIMGSDDHRMPSGWIEQLKKTGKTIRIIEGAGHFLDGVHEFDLQDILNEEARLSDGG
jgi:pimeloyl-ACP methyl ester carboxylesterase